MRNKKQEQQEARLSSENLLIQFLAYFIVQYAKTILRLDSGF